MSEGSLSGKEFSLSRRERIKKKKEMEAVFSSGKVFRGDFLMLRLYRRQESEDKPRFAFLLTKKIKTAVARNRIKRLMREVVRQNKEKFFPGDRVVILASQQAQNKGLKEFESEFLSIIQKAGIKSGA
jgi:ribonuclease P protein component